MLTIVMYHYVRDAEQTRFAGLKTRTRDEFAGQLDFIAARYRVIAMDELLAALADDALDRLPENAALLTFDDGYREHIEHVMPELQRRGMSAAFFVPAQPALDGEIIDVNKLHLVLAIAHDAQRLVTRTREVLRAAAGADAAQWDPWANPSLSIDSSRFDDPDIVRLKRLLQRDLPESLRREVVGELFAEYVMRPEAAVVHELYMTLDELRSLRAAGMYIGHHSDTHPWLDRLDEAAQRREIERPLELLEAVGVPRSGWAIAYPFGAASPEIVRLVREYGGRVGLTTRVAVADLRRDDPLRLPRLDTNDLPTEANGRPASVLRGVAASTAGAARNSPSTAFRRGESV